MFGYGQWTWLPTVVKMILFILYEHIASPSSTDGFERWLHGNQWPAVPIF